MAVLLAPRVPLAQAAEAPKVHASTVAGNSMGRVLLEAVEAGDARLAQELIDAGADVNFPLIGDGTALIIAAGRGDKRLVELLIASGADVNLGVLGDGNPLIRASARGDLGIVTQLVEHGANVNGFVAEDETPLINAARAGRLEVINYLVSKGADVNLAVPARRFPGIEMRSPLGEARKHGGQAVVERLRALGATQGDAAGSR
jgi:ankyrin repeat protein